MFGFRSKNGRSFHSWRNLLEQLQPFRREPVLEALKAGRVAARPREGRNLAAADRIVELHEHNGHGSGELL
jgi:hypothetical protein